MRLLLALIAIGVMLVMINPIYMPFLLLVGAISFFAAVVSWLREPTI